MSRFKRRNGDNAESERSNGAAMELPERESLLAADAPAPNEPAASSSRRSSPRAPNHNPPADVVAASKPVLSSPRATAQADMPTVSREGSRRDRPPRLELAAQPSSRSQLSRNNSNATPENDARPSPRVQIVTPGPSHRSVPPLPIETASGRLLSTSPGVDDGYTEPPNEPASGAGAVVKRQSQDVKGQEDRLERLRALHQTCCLSWVTGSFRYFRIGYDINPFYRKTSFAEANKGLDLRREGQGVQLSVIIGDIDTYKEHVAGLIRPIVRVHAVDLESGLYIRSADRDPAAPACTRPQLSFNSGSSASWTQELLLDAHYYDVVNERSLLLFEILDEKPSLSLDKNTREKQQYWKKVAWGYLLPVGSNGQLNVGVANRQVLGGGLGGQSARTPRIVTGRAKEDREPPKRPYHRNLRIQLYHYRRYDGLVGLIQRSMLAWPQLDPRYLSLDDASHPNGVPSAYLQWRLLQKNPVQGAFLTISIGPKAMKLRTPRLLGTSESEKSHTDDTDADNEDNDELLSPRSKAAAAAAKEGESLYERLIRRKKKRIKSKEESNKLRSASLRRVRRQEEPCVIPERFLRRLDVGPDGAMVVSFSHCGHLLAIAAKYDTLSAPLYNNDVVYSLILYDTDTDEEVWAEYIAHHAVIYDIQWSKNDRYLLTCAGDGSCKVWDLLYFCPLLDAIERAKALAQAQTLSSTVADNTASNAQPTPREGEGQQSSSEAAGLEAFAGISKSEVLISHPPRIIQILSLGSALYSYCGLFQEFNVSTLLSTMQLINTFQGSTVSGLLGVPTLQEQFHAIERGTVPRIIIGCADGRLRVFEDNRFLGFISVPSDSPGEENTEDFSPHDAQINALVIDERSKYLISGDANGDVFAWRLDRTGWYQILRKFKRNPPPNATANPLYNAQTSALEQFDNGSILTMQAHPLKAKSMLMVHSRQPATIKVVSLTTYKPISFCEGYTGIPQTYLVREDASIFSAGVFFRAIFSADGRFIVSCNTTHSASSLSSRGVANGGTYKLLVWDTYTGHPIQTPLSALTFPYPVRSLSWHPCQHLLAISMVGEGAAVALYCMDADNSLKIVDRKAEAAVGNALNTTASTAALIPPAAPVDASLRFSVDRNSSPLPPLTESRDELNYSLLDNSAFVHGRSSSALDGTAQVLMGTRNISQESLPLSASPSKSSLGETFDKDERISRARDLLERVRANRAK